MFSRTRTSTLGQRALDALGLVRSFLLLEDDYDVDWEVDQEEWIEVDHPHRAALRRGRVAERLARRRPGQLESPPQVCVSPVRNPAAVSHPAAVTRPAATSPPAAVSHPAGPFPAAASRGRAPARRSDSAHSR